MLSVTSGLAWNWLSFMPLAMTTSSCDPRLSVVIQERRCARRDSVRWEPGYDGLAVLVLLAGGQGGSSRSSAWACRSGMGKPSGPMVLPRSF